MGTVVSGFAVQAVKAAMPARARAPAIKARERTREGGAAGGVVNCDECLERSCNPTITSLREAYRPTLLSAIPLEQVIFWIGSTYQIRDQIEQLIRVQRIHQA